MKKMTTFLGGALIAAALLLSGCQNFLTANADAREKLQAEIKYAKAETVSFTIAPVSSEDGQVTSKATSAKIGFPVAIEFEVNQKVGSFVRWDVYSNYKGDGSDVALTDAVKFEREDARKTEMTIMSAVPNLRIIPRVSANPKVRLVTAKNELLQSMGSITPSGTQAWNPDNTHDISAESENGYAIKGWKVYKKSGETDVPVTSVKATDGDGNDLTRKYFGFDAPENPDIEFLSINLSETQKKSTATIKFSGSDIEGLYFEPVFAERPTLQHCFDYLENDRILSSQSFVFEMNHPFNITEIKNSIYVEVISGGTKNKGDFSVSESGNNFTVKLEGNIPANSPVTLLMYNTLKDSNGITVGGETRAYKFTTTADGTPPVLSGPDTRLYYKGNTTDYVTYATFRETSLSTIKNHSQDTYSYSTTKTQFRFYISATDVGGSLAQYEIVERIKYLPANMIIPKNREIKEGVTYEPEEYDYIANGTLVFDNDDKLQSPFENEDFYKKTWTIAANNSTSQSINHYFSTKIPIGGIHEFSVTAIDAHGNRSKTLRMYIRFINKRFDFELPTTYGTDKVSQMSTLSMTASPTGFDDDGGMGSVLQKIRNSNYFVVEKWNNQLRIEKIGKAYGVVRQTDSYEYSSTYRRDVYLTLKPNSKISGSGITYSMGYADDYGIIYNPAVTGDSSYYQLQTKTGMTYTAITVGDVIMRNPITGNVYTMPAEELSYYEGNNIPIAVVVSLKDNKIIGIAIKGKYLYWAKDSSLYYAQTQFNNGSPKEGFWDSFTNQVYTNKSSEYAKVNENYPALYYCYTYGTNVLGFDPDANSKTNEYKLARGWYMPSWDDTYSTIFDPNSRVHSAFYTITGTSVSAWTLTGVSQIKAIGGGSPWKYTRMWTYPFHDFTDIINK